jgi:hypothetical protein
MAVTETAASNFPRPQARGTFRVYTSDDPAAGAEFTVTVPTGKVWRVLGLTVTLVTDANAASRNLQLLFDDGANNLFYGCSTPSQTASTTWTYFAEASNIQPPAASNNIGIIIPGDIMLGPAYRIRSVTAGKQVGDNYGAPIIFVEEWNTRE